jgi:hypothetical protein
MNPAERAPLIARYREGPRRVREALEGITDAELDVRPAPEAWTVREVVHHLPDSEMTSAIRLRRLLAEDAPVLGGYDEEQFARTLRYADRPIESALELFDLVRRVTAEILERMTEREWAREGTHGESGRYSCETWLEIYAAHAHDHADQIRRAREATSGL